MANYKNGAKNWIKDAINKDAFKKAMSNEKSKREIMAILAKIKY